MADLSTNGSPGGKRRASTSIGICHNQWALLPTGAADHSGPLLPIVYQPGFKDVLTSNQFLYNNQACSSNLKVAQHLGKLRMISSQLSVSLSHNKSPPL